MQAHLTVTVCIPFPGQNHNPIVLSICNNNEIVMLNVAVIFCDFLVYKDASSYSAAETVNAGRKYGAY